MGRARGGSVAPAAVASSLLAGAAAVDVVVHAAHLTALETPAHLATLVGMVATLAVVVGSRARRSPARSKESRNAVR